MPPMSTIVCLPDISEKVSGNGCVLMDFLLPNGMYIQLNVDFNKPLDLLKQKLWESARQFPLYNKLKEKENYFIEYLNRSGEREEVTDESLRLSELRPIGQFLRLQERKLDGEVKTLDRQITMLLGNKSQMEKSHTEVDDFRRRMVQFALFHAPCRTNYNQMFETRYPLQLRSSVQFPSELQGRLNQGWLVVMVRVKEAQTRFPVQCNIDETAEAIVDNAIRKWRNHSVRNTYDYILKVVGQEDYLYGKVKIHRFKYIYTCIQRGLAPQFWLLHKTEVLPQVAHSDAPLPRPPAPHMQNKHKDVIVWDIDDKFQVDVRGIFNIEITSDQVKDNIEKVNLFVGLYHGSEVLGDVQTTSEKAVVNGNCNLDMTLTFGIQVKDMQTASRLCFTLHGRMKGARSLNPIAWVNIPVFDFRSRLLTGEHELAMWPVTAELQLEETRCYPLGTVSPNPHGTIKMTVTFSDYKRNPPIVFPSDDKITECAADNMERPGTEGHPWRGGKDWSIPDTQLRQLDKILSTRQWEALHELDKDLVWNSRFEIREKYPDALPLVLRSVKWQSHVDVAKMQVLLSTWRQTIPVDYALELLDFNFPDRKVRKYAIDCLHDLSDDEVSLYLLQLVQALKYENYLYCPLAEFLMERALRNQHIGQQLFWLLRSELHDPTVTMRFGLMLEAYLKASPDHLDILMKQYEALNKLNAVSQLVKSATINNDRDREQAHKHMRAVLDQKTYQQKLSHLISPLSPLFRVMQLNTAKCKFMDSKKRPLYLVWSNEDDEGEEIHIIYKNGDDLRQDMLTLQMLQVMDSIWQAEGLDLRLTPYGCIATGLEQGMIEVVRFSATLANIQKGSAFDKKTLFGWLEKKCPDGPALDNAVHEFMLSCAGYTVATYVLGIGDRHNDNIMLKESGQLFHIDFGHFLGNFKSKYGFKRERVPFVLTSHFEYIIKKGDRKKENYEDFKKYCEDAYLALRRRGNLLIRLFMMMLTSGIPQLTSVNDLDYIKNDTLCLHLSEEEALKQFRRKMEDSLNSLSTKVNWSIHMLVH